MTVETGALSPVPLPPLKVAARSPESASEPTDSRDRHMAKHNSRNMIRFFIPLLS